MIKEKEEKTPAAVFPQQPIENLIYEVRGVQVMLDRDLAQLYEVEVGQMNRQVKRNKERFPEDFMFQLSKEEWDSLKCHFGISKMKGGDRYLPYVFTEQGVSALSGILRSEFAIRMNIQIIRARLTVMCVSVARLTICVLRLPIIMHNIPMSIVSSILSIARMTVS